MSVMKMVLLPKPAIWLGSQLAFVRTYANTKQNTLPRGLNRESYIYIACMREFQSVTHFRRRGRGRSSAGNCVILFVYLFYAQKSTPIATPIATLEWREPKKKFDYMLKFGVHVLGRYIPKLEMSGVGLCRKHNKAHTFMCVSRRTRHIGAFPWLGPLHCFATTITII